MVVTLAKHQHGPLCDLQPHLPPSPISRLPDLHWSVPLRATHYTCAPSYRCANRAWAYILGPGVPVLD